MTLAKTLSRLSIVSGVALFVIYTLYSTASAGLLPFSVPQVPVLVSFMAIIVMSVFFGTAIFLEGEIIPEQPEPAYEE